MRSDFYVYAWIRPDTGDAFYIGKGTGGRAEKRWGRNSIFERILNKLKIAGLVPSIVKIHEGLTEDGAHELEKAEIAALGRINIGTGPLANLTDGGEGQVGFRHRPESKSKISLSKTGVPIGPHSPETKVKIADGNRGKRRSPQAILHNRVAQHNTGVTATNTSGFRGVSFHSDRSKWGARIMINGREKNLGRFDTPEEAALVRDKAAIAAFGADKVFLNFPDRVAA